MLNEVPDHRDGAFGCIWDNGMPAICEPFELSEMRRQRCCDIRLALDRMDRIVFTAEDESRTLDAVKIPEHVERVALAARSCEPMQYL